MEEFNSIPSLELVHDQDNADALRRQLIMSPANQEVTVPIPTDTPVPPVTKSSILTSDPHLPSDADIYNDDNIGTKCVRQSNIQLTCSDYRRNSVKTRLRCSL